MTQPDLTFAGPALSRTRDPETSRMAAAAVTASGQAATNRELCYAAVARQPGLTSGEVAGITGLDRHEAARRLPELRQGDTPLLANLPPSNPARKRLCRVCGTPSLTWWLANKIKDGGNKTR